MILEHDIAGARAHPLDGLLFADGAGREDDGDVSPARAHDFERRRRVELRQGAVAQHEVPLGLGQRGRERLRRVTRRTLGSNPTLPELAEQQRRVVLRALDQEEAERRAQRRPPCGGSLRSAGAPPSGASSTESTCFSADTGA